MGMGDGDWGIGIGGLGIGPNPQSPIPNPQSPIPISSYNFSILIVLKKSKFLLKICIKNERSF